MRLLATLCAFTVISAHAVTVSTDFSDLWFNANEEGWGTNVIQQNEILFVTIFVYGPSGQPTWFVGPSTAKTTTGSDGSVNFAGPLYTVTGPYFGAGTFNEAQVSARPVGVVAFSFPEISGGAVSYTVDGVSVTKSIRRQTWRGENLNGIYIAGSLGTYTGCGAAQNGYFENPITLTVGHDGGSTITMREQGSNYFCNYSGTYTQEGRMGMIQGSGTCSDGTNQTFRATEVQSGLQGLTMRFTSLFTGTCTSVGRMGGVRRGS